MGENTEKKAEKAEKTGEEKTKTPAVHKARVKQKSRWTLEGSPSSYKAAAARNWVKECSAGFKKEKTSTGRSLPKSA